jgi:large subunit ribosomal protein L4
MIMKAKVYNIKGKVVGEVDLSDEIFGRAWNSDLVHQVLMAQRSNRRKNIAHAKDRSEVRGGGKKPWRQKGTGRARHGSTRSPIWVGGGVTHGPRNEKNYKKKINKKMVRAAINSAVSRRLADGELKVVDAVTISAPKTKELALVIRKFSDKEVPSALIVTSESKENISRSARNIPKVKAVPASTVNLEDLLKYETILFEKEAALKMVQ